MFVITGYATAFLPATSMLCALHGGEAERGDVGDSRPCLDDDCGLFIWEKHSGDAQASREFPVGRAEET